MNLMYRCWDPHNEKMIYPDKYETDFKYHNGKWMVYFTKEVNKVINGIEQDLPVWGEVEEPVMMVSFGQKDRKGKYIYEDDVVKSWNLLDEDGQPSICKVVWNKSYFCIERLSGGGTGLHKSDGEFGVEVISNSFQYKPL